MSARPTVSPPPAPPGHRSRARWAGCAGPPLLWLTQFELRYALAGAAPGSVQHYWLTGSAIAALVLLGWLFALAWRAWRDAAGSPLDEFAGVVPRNRFMGALGMLLSALFFLVTAAQFLADWFIAPGR